MVSELRENSRGLARSEPNFEIHFSKQMELSKGSIEKMAAKKQWNEWIWDAWCLISFIGIWPRFIEPRLLGVTRLQVKIPSLPEQLYGIKILHFSDLHWSQHFSSSLQQKMIRKINALEPDIIVFTGDFLCRSKLENQDGLKQLLNALKAKIGYFAVLGNHDYAQFVSVSSCGDYDVEKPSSSSNIVKGFKRLFHPVKLTKRVTDGAKQVAQHDELLALLKKTPFQLLNNASQLVPVNGSWINICGLEEYSLGRSNPDQACHNYDRRYPGIVLTHNPDAVELLQDYPGELILSGHTHGGQVNLPGLWSRFTPMENMQFKHGLKKINDKRVYINRGISGVMKFRWFAQPELTLVTLQGSK